MQPRTLQSIFLYRQENRRKETLDPSPPTFGEENLLPPPMGGG